MTFNSITFGYGFVACSDQNSEVLPCSALILWVRDQNIIFSRTLGVGRTICHSAQMFLLDMFGTCSENWPISTTKKPMQILCLTITHSTFVYAILCTSVAEHVAEPQKGEKWCSDSVPSAEHAEQSEHSFSARILAEFWALLWFWSFFKTCSDQNIQLSIRAIIELDNIGHDLSHMTCRPQHKFNKTYKNK